MDLSEVRMNAFFGEDVYYDLGERNYIVESIRSEEESSPQEE